MAEPLHFAYVPGGATAVCGDTSAGLIGLPPDHELIPDIVQVMRDGSDLDEVLEILVRPGLRAVHDFALLQLGDGGVRVVLRGGYVATVQGRSEVITGAGLWVDRLIEDAPSVSIAVREGVEGLQLGVGSGVVLADRIGQPAAEEPAAEEAEDDEAAAAPAPEPETSAAEPEPAGPAEETIAEPPPAPSAVPEPAPAPEPEERRPEGQSPPTMPLDPAAVGAAGAAGALAGAAGAAADPGLTLPPAPAAGGPQPPVSQQSPRFIDSVPWGNQTPQPQQPPNGQQPPTPEHPASPATQGTPTGPPAGQMTVDRAALPSDEPLVVAARCPQGHLSPAYAAVCRVCRQPMPPQQPFETTRPPLGVLRLSNGDDVVLDRGCILGRNPRLPEGYTGEQPNLVQLVDPAKDISGQHLEVRLDYWHVSVRDLGSTNGTEVILPGEGPIHLRPNDPITIEPGTKIILAGVLEIYFEVTA